MANKLKLYLKAAQSAKIGIWEIDLKENTIYWDMVTRSIHEVPSNFTPSPDNTLSFYPEGRDQSLIAKLISESIKEGTPFSEKFRIISYRGNLKHVEVNCQAVYEDDQCVLLVGTFQDITTEHNLINELELNVEKFHQAFEYASIGMALVSIRGNWLKANKSLCNTFGYTEEELSGITFQEITHPDDLDLDLNFSNQMIRREIENYQMEKRYFHKNGQIVWAHLSVSLVWKEDETPLYFICQIKDITESKFVSEALNEERIRLAGIIEATNVGTWEWEVQTGKTILNERWANMLGYKLEELYPINFETWANLMHPEDLKNSNIQLQKCFTKEITHLDNESRMKHKNGHWVWIQHRGKVVNWSPTNEPILMLGTHTDITERKEKEKRYSAVFNSTFQFTGLLTTDGTLIDVNETALNFAGIKQKEIIGKKFWKINWWNKAPETEKLLKENIKKAAKGEFIRYNVQIKGIKGVYIWVDFSIKPVFNDQGEVYLLIPEGRDITQQKASADKMRQLYLIMAESKDSITQSLFNTLKTGTELLGMEAGFISENIENTYKILHNYPTAHPVKPGDFFNLEGSFCDFTLKKKDVFTINHVSMSKLKLHPYYRSIQVESYIGIPLRVNGKFYGTLTFISTQIKSKNFAENDLEFIRMLGKWVSTLIETRTTKKALEDSEKHYRTFYELSPIGIILIDIETGRYIDVNSAFLDMVGYSEEEIKKLSFWEISPEKYRDEANHHLDQLKLTGKYGPFVKEYIHKSGQLISVSLNGVKITRHNNGSYIYSTVENITDRIDKEIELRSTLDLVSEQNKRLLNFAHIVSHNLRSHAGNFELLLNLLKEEINEDEKVELVDLLITNANNLQETVENLNEVVKIQIDIKQQLKELNLFDEIQKAILTVNGPISDTNAQISIVVPKNLTLKYNPAYMESILLNVLSNAIKYKDPNRDPKIEVKLIDDPNYIIITVEDNGLGIDLEQNRHKLFGMYKTFHQNKDARGIGLFITKNQIEALEGKIEVSSTVGIGTTFSIFLKKQ
ncbi:PAS domain S-box protein [Flavobacterium sp. '19STA2R22 D10 B1']|uniref:PAS domain S-box protein n=1 Tax=Flavobacterium aerium TaxID=3037261 RepID=UPI00278BEE5D|nr:PAS domain S-box protein [Flavobacterium sp. '19STA2R22 D10 B1']